MTNYNQKLAGLENIKGSFAFDKTSLFCELEDHYGWSDGIIADFRAGGVEIMKAKAVLKGAKLSESKPKIQPVIPEGNHVVDDIEYVLADNQIELKNLTVTARVQPKYLKHFLQGTQVFDELVLTDKKHAVKVLAGGELIGLIMPILHS